MKRAVVSFALPVLIAAWAIVAASQNAQVSLTDPRWNLIKVNGVAVTDSNAYLRFDPQTYKFHGSSSCNFIGGSYKANGPNLKIFQVYITRRACQDPEVEKVEKEFLKLFNATTSFAIHDDVLRLYKDDQVTLVFKAARTEKSN